LLAAIPAATTGHINRVRDAWTKKHRTYDERATPILAWAKWAITHGQAREALDEVTRAQRDIEGDTLIRKASREEDEREKKMAVQRLESEWKGMLQAMEKRQADDEDEDMDSE
jgi:hypothetical protein